MDEEKIKQILVNYSKSVNDSIQEKITELVFDIEKQKEKIIAGFEPEDLSMIFAIGALESCYRMTAKILNSVIDQSIEANKKLDESI